MLHNLGNQHANDQMPPPGPNPADVASGRKAMREVNGIDNRVDRLALLCEAVWELVEEQTNLNMNDLHRKVREIDELPVLRPGRAADVTFRRGVESNSDSMTSTRRTFTLHWLALVLLSLVAAACGTSDTSSQAGQPESLAMAETGVPVAPSTTQPATTTIETNTVEASNAQVDDDNTDANIIVVQGTKTEVEEVLEEAVSFAPGEGVRITSSVGMEFKAPRAGINIESTLDPNRPNVTALYLDNGTHIDADVGPLIAALSPPDLADTLDQIRFELWINEDESIIADTNGFQPLATLTGDPSVLGTFRPGVWSANGAGNLSPEQLAQYLIGAPAPNPDDVINRLPGLLADPTISDDGRVISGTANYADVAEVLTMDLRISAETGAESVAQSMGVNEADLRRPLGARAVEHGCRFVASLRHDLRGGLGNRPAYVSCRDS